MHNPLFSKWKICSKSELKYSRGIHTLYCKQTKNILLWKAIHTYLITLVFKKLLSQNGKKKKSNIQEQNDIVCLFLDVTQLFDNICTQFLHSLHFAGLENMTPEMKSMRNKYLFRIKRCRCFNRNESSMVRKIIKIKIHAKI